MNAFLNHVVLLYLGTSRVLRRSTVWWLRSPRFLSITWGRIEHSLPPPKPPPKQKNLRQSQIYLPIPTTLNNKHTCHVRLVHPVAIYRVPPGSFDQQRAHTINGLMPRSANGDKTVVSRPRACHELHLASVSDAYPQLISHPFTFLFHQPIHRFGLGRKRRNFSQMEELGIQTPVVPPLALPKAKDWLPHQEEQQDVYVKLKKLEKELDLLLLQEDYIKDEQRHLKRELVRAQEEVKRIRSVPLVIGQFLEPIDENNGIVSSTTGSNYVVRILSTLDRELLKPSSSVALHRHSNALVDILPPEADSSISIVGDNQKPDVTYADVGGLDVQKQEIREAVELPLTQGDLYSQIGIDPPRGVLLYGPPGTGKTMLVKAVANSTTASFIRINGSEFVQKYLGEGPRMVRDVFRLARENSPAIIFIDEVDAIATKRYDAQTGADREVQRILLELLNQMDGFDQTSNVKVIMATNRADTLDPALLRPGRLDRKIEFPSLKDRRERRLIFSTVASKMALAPEVDLDSLIVRNDPLSGAVIAAIMQEAGLRAVRKNRYMILQSDLEEAYAAQVKTGTEHDKFDFYK